MSRGEKEEQTGRTARVTLKVPKTFGCELLFYLWYSNFFERPELSIAGIVHQDIDADKTRESSFYGGVRLGFYTDL